MANTAVKVSATPNRLTYLLTGDGTVIGPTLANATLLADMVAGPLRDAWNKTYIAGGVGDQATMRTALLGGGQDCSADILLMETGNNVDAQVNQPCADVDTDAVTTTKAEINISMSDTTGQIAMLTLEHYHSIRK